MTEMETITAKSGLGLALEGGGAKGAYHMGVVKAYLEMGHTFDAVVGTSIGAINAAVIAQGDFESGYRMWEMLDARSIFDMNDEEYLLMLHRKLDTSTLSHLAAHTRKLLAGRGINTQKMKQLIASVVDEEKLRSASADFGLVTVSLTDRMPHELYKDDIPQGRLADYLMASAAFPGFQPTVIDNKSFIDGGLYDNCPINMLARKGYTQVIAIRTRALGINRKVQYPDINVTTIAPSEPLGGMMSFNPEAILRSLNMGYYDAIRQLRSLQGRIYCIDVGSLNEEMCKEMLETLPGDKVIGIGRMLSMDGGLSLRELWSKAIMPRLSASMRLPEDTSTMTFIISLAETLAAAKGVNKYAIYSFDEWINAAVSGPLRHTSGFDFHKVALCMAAQRILEAIELPAC
ncbi:patatin-like phospholipase family protein [Paenibacillus sp. J5C_2022]|uniref:patatin-like phospholipase family protein n=1 Tax=Paenibacillus sp. J5C2022 TaxID=2977129 RepID=UPI0021CF5270|nr:patatin-like phospholipase family protein [Paenibacillus sp. J5C2022]MCU6712863.1 patatin-like phospholipase family protein [Paenibacillus sp. J5C2022]